MKHRKPYKFEQILWTSEDHDGIEFYLNGEATPGEPECRYGHPDNWTPEDPMEVEILSVFVKGKGISEKMSIEDCVREYNLDWQQDVDDMCQVVANELMEQDKEEPEYDPYED